MKFKNKLIVITAILGGISSGCNDFLDEDPVSQIETTTFYKDGAAAEIGLTGCYNKFFDQNSYPFFDVLIQLSTDDIKQPSGFAFKYKTRANMLASEVNAGPWNAMYKAIANVNFMLREVEKIPESAFVDAARKTEILAEGHFIRGAAYYYLSVGWGDVPLITDFPEDITETLIDKSPRETILEFVKQEFRLAEEGLPDVLDNYASDPVTNARKGRASKWAAKAYLARLALQENDWQRALSLSDEIINSGLYPFTSVWRTIFQHPMNASESIFEQQNDLSPGFFGSGTFGWYFGYDFEWSDNALSIFEKPAVIGTTQGKDVRFDLAYTKFTPTAAARPNKYIPVRGFADGGIESMNLTIIRLSELLLNKAEALNELDFAAHKTEVIDILNMIRARAEDAAFKNTFFTNAPVGTTGIPPLDPANFTTQDELRQAIRVEKRREFIFEDVIRWVDLYRWDKTYLKTITNSPTDEHLFWPIPPDEIVRNPQLVQNPAYAGL
jgi:starch-binding outer membrane protein, SusD/RagB family